VHFRDGKGIRPADGVVALGFPYAGLLASSPQVTVGAVSALAGLEDDSRYLQLTAPVQPGNSGGPLFDLSGNVVGVVSGRINDLAVAKATGSLPQNINFASKSGIVREFLDANRVVYLTAPSNTKLDPADVGEAATKSTVLIGCSK
jgi:S1-C subfamily serine protease